MIRQRGLSQKVFIFTTILIVLIIASVLGILYFILPGYYLGQKSKILEKRADALEVSLNEAKTKDECARLISGFAETNNSIIIAFDTNNLLLPELSSFFLSINEPQRENLIFHYTIKDSRIEGSGFNSTLIPSVNLEKQPENTNKLRIIDSNSIGTFFVTQNISSATITKFLDNGIIGHIIISSTLQPIDEAKSVIISLIPYLLAIAFIIALLAAYIFAKHLTKPILKISGAAALMQDMRPDALSNIRTEDELGQLSYNLDSLYMKLCENIQNLQLEMNKVTKLEQAKTDFMRAAGHELKTPVATLNGMIEGMLDNIGAYKNHEKYLGECKEQLTRLAKLVNEILMATQLERENSVVYEDTNINDIVDEALYMYGHLIKKKQLRIKKDDFEFTYETDSHLLRNTLSNLISNAVSYTAPGEKINILFTENATGNTLSIENQCDNIAADMLPKLFEPFFTLNYSRNKEESGTGLGLYIVKRNLDAIKLPYKIENTETGLKFSIIFCKSC